ncbi:tRNA (adenosine(37)-N6)-threonylcarbamoyltransferase complex dimerization subunit type 1 TsaB [Pediococcus siamensis]|uniref:tRNA (adenosine(37)-N6)-threonylcarbamoyltransferase complex dimerization subunit type 1 TsaB n=1 Tax=Pediococcus siamensis TaxID=381829 RepID=UPI0039A184A2
MKILAIDTSNRPLSVAVLDDDQLLAMTTTNIRRNHSIQLLPIIETLLKQAGLSPKDLQRIVVAQGPGSYTGLRIATTTAKTLAYTLNIDLVGVSSLKTLAGNVNEAGRLIVPLFDARRQNVFAGIYRQTQRGLVEVMADQHVAIAELATELIKKHEPVYFVGADVATYANYLTEQLGSAFNRVSPAQDLPSAYVLGQLGSQAKPVSQPFDFVPNYLRLTEAEVEWKKHHPQEDTKPYVEKI